MDYHLYGFLIENEFHIDIKNKCIYRIMAGGKDSNITFSVLYLNDTMMRFFLYLLTHARNNFVARDEVLKNVWDENNLSSSNTRLWQVLTNMRKKFEHLNMPEDLIQHVKKKGYIIRCKNIVPLYYKKDESHDFITFSDSKK